MPVRSLKDDPHTTIPRVWVWFLHWTATDCVVRWAKSLLVLKKLGAIDRMCGSRMKALLPPTQHRKIQPARTSVAGFSFSGLCTEMSAIVSWNGNPPRSAGPRVIARLQRPPDKDASP
ncbi:hypothetical protein ACW7BJ_28025 [Azospirillum argentinense]